jgi:hypothetical protein
MYGFAPFPPPAKHAKLWKLYLLGSVAIDIGLLLGLLLFGGFAAVTVLDDVGQYYSARNSQNWPSVTGTISSSGTVREGKRFGVVANYSYPVGNEVFSGNRLIFSARRPVVATEEEANILLAPFGRLTELNEFSSTFDGILPKADRRVTVFYDPSGPGDSTLRREYFANPELSGLWPALPISAFLIFILVWSIQSWKKYISNKEYETAARSRLPA